MANARTYVAQALASNGVDIDGLSQLTFNGNWRDIIQSVADGAVGVEDVDRAGLDIDVTLATADVLEGVNLLDGAAGDTKWRSKESGAATWHTYLIDQSEDGWIVWHGMHLAFAKNSYGTLVCDGKICFAGTAKDWVDILEGTAAVETAAAITATRATGLPVRKFRPYTGQFGGTIDITHVESLNLDLTANLLTDYSDTDVGLTAVDREGWNPLQVSMTFRDHTIATGSLAARLGDAARGALTCNLTSTEGGGAVVVTINNLLWTSIQQVESGSADYAMFTATGQCGWQTGGTPYTLGAGTPLFSFA